MKKVDGKRTKNNKAAITDNGCTNKRDDIVHNYIASYIR